MSLCADKARHVLEILWKVALRTTLAVLNGAHRVRKLHAQPEAAGSTKGRTLRPSPMRLRFFAARWEWRRCLEQMGLV